jgi:serine/threonine protein phosphatase 1
MFHYNDVIEERDVLACGDIHGMSHLYFQFLDWVRDSGARVVLLGDLIDRGPDDFTVLNRTRDLMQDPESWGLQSFTVTRGNHEQMFLNAIDGYDMECWIRNGGDYENLHLLIEHEDWIRQLPYYVTVGDIMFSHAGCYPGEDPALSMNSHIRREEFIWMRQPFLSEGPQFEKWNPNLKKIVFGHTPRGPLPYRIPNGICIDTGAFQTGTLTAYNATQDTFCQFETENA